MREPRGHWAHAERDGHPLKTPLAGAGAEPRPSWRVEPAFCGPGLPSARWMVILVLLLIGALLVLVILIVLLLMGRL